MTGWDKSVVTARSLCDEALHARGALMDCFRPVECTGLRNDGLGKTPPRRHCEEALRRSSPWRECSDGLLPGTRPGPATASQLRVGIRASSLRGGSATPALRRGAVHGEGTLMDCLPQVGTKRRCRRDGVNGGSPTFNGGPSTTAPGLPGGRWSCSTAPRKRRGTTA